MFEVKQINWPWQGTEEIVLKPDARQESELAEIRILVKGKATGQTKIGDKFNIVIKPA